MPEHESVLEARAHMEIEGFTSVGLEHAMNQDAQKSIFFQIVDKNVHRQRVVHATAFHHRLGAGTWVVQAHALVKDRVRWRQKKECLLHFDASPPRLLGPRADLRMDDTSLTLNLHALDAKSLLTAWRRWRLLASSLGVPVRH